MRVIRWTNSGYENGRIAGRFNRHYMRQLLEIVDPGRWQEMARAGRNDSLASWARHWSRRDFTALAVHLHEQSLASLPPLDRFPELRGMDQYMADYTRGLAGGTGFSFEEMVWAQQYRNVYIYAHTPTQPMPALPGVVTGCTTIVFARSDQGPIIGRNMDDQLQWGDKFPRFGEATLNVNPPERGYSYIDIDGGGMVNERGLMIYGSSITYPLEPETTERFPLGNFDLVLRHCATVAEAVTLIERYSAFGCPSNLVLVDAEGNAAAVEKGKTHCAVRLADERGVVFATSGVALEPAMSQFMDTAGTSYQWNLGRYRRIESLVADGPLTVEHMWSVVADHHPTEFVCKHFDRVAPGDLGTIHQYVVLPAQAHCFARQYDAETGQHPCAFDPVEHWWSFAPLHHVTDE